MQRETTIKQAFKKSTCVVTVLAHDSLFNFKNEKVFTACSAVKQINAFKYQIQLKQKVH